MDGEPETRSAQCSLLLRSGGDGPECCRRDLPVVLEKKRGNKKQKKKKTCPWNILEEKDII